MSATIFAWIFQIATSSGSTVIQPKGPGGSDSEAEAMKARRRAAAAIASARMRGETEGGSTLRGISPRKLRMVRAMPLLSEGAAMAVVVAAFMAIDPAICNPIWQVAAQEDMNIASNRQSSAAVHTQDLAGDVVRIPQQPQHRTGDILRRALPLQGGTLQDRCHRFVLDRLLGPQHVAWRHAVDAHVRAKFLRQRQRRHRQRGLAHAIGRVI